MAKILFIWELGGGAGHIAPHRGLARALQRAGHQVAFAVRNPDAAKRVLRDQTCIAAPALPRSSGLAKPARSYAQILHQVGFADLPALERLVSEWRKVLRDVSPDIVILDHAPGALVAVRGASIPVLALGAGFYHPPLAAHCLDLRPWLPPSNGWLQDEERVLMTINAVLARQGSPRIDRLSDLFRDTAATLLTTYQALDPYHRWPGRRYIGAAASGGAEPPPWPPGDGPRGFCYLSPSRAAMATLCQLKKLRCPTLVSVSAGSTLGMTVPRSPFLTQLAGHVDLQQVANTCDFAVLNGNHFSTIEFLRAGKPVLQLPVTLDQTHVALATRALGAGLIAPLADTDVTLSTLARFMQQLDSLRRAAELCSPGFRELDGANGGTTAVLETIEDCATRSPAPPASALPSNNSRDRGARSLVPDPRV